MKTLGAFLLFPGGNSGSRFSSARAPACSLAESTRFDSCAHSGPGSFLNLKDRAGRESVCLAVGLTRS